jgi:anti-sigma regulatory factor (Ser/Thr protein kinase)
MTGNSPRQPAIEAPTDAPLDAEVDIDSLYSLRASVAAHAADLGMAEDRLSKLLVVANELATNAIRYANGRARLRLWRDGDAVYCQVTDNGPGIDDPDVAGTHEVPLNATGGRGLWIVRRLSDHVVIANPGAGAAITAVINI